MRALALIATSALCLAPGSANAQSQPGVRQIVRDNPYEPVPAPPSAQRPASGAHNPSLETELLGAAAHALYEAGSDAFADKRFVEAALDFEAAAAEKASAVALYTAALSWERAGTADRAADDYARALGLPGLPADQTAATVERLATLERTLGTVNVAAPPGWRVNLDANSELSAPVKLHGAPGTHTLAIHRLGRPVESRSLVLVQGATGVVDLTPTASSDPTASAVAPETPGTRSDSLARTAGIAVLGAAGMGLVAGTLLGFEALDARDAYRAAPSQPAFDHARQLETWTNVAFVAGGVLCAGGLALVFWPWPWRTPPATAPTGTTRPGIELRAGPDGLHMRESF